MKNRLKPEMAMQALLAEYDGRLTEIRSRSTSENTLLQIHITTITALLAGVFNFPSGIWLLFLIPLESSLFGLWWVDNSMVITEIGCYIRTHIEPAVSRLSGMKKAMFWENSRLCDQNVLSRKKDTLFGPLVKVTFTLPSIICLSLLFIIIVINVMRNTVFVQSRISDLPPQMILSTTALTVAIILFCLDVLFLKILLGMFNTRTQEICLLKKKTEDK